MMEIFIILAISISVVLIAGLLIKISSLKAQNQYFQQQISEFESVNSAIKEQEIKYIQNIERLKSENEYLQKQNQDIEKIRKESYESAKASLVDLGNNLSKQLIDLHKKENSESRQQSEETLNKTTNKLFDEFNKIVNTVSVLNNEVQQSKSTVEIVKNSLLSPSGAGSLAEITLENILKSSGLRSKSDYSMQYSMSNSSSSGQKLRPDALVFLPNDNLMIIDAKASKFLVDWNSSEDQNQTEDSLAKDMMRTMNNHLKDLSSKDYKENLMAHFEDSSQNYNNIITLMFVPSEHAIEKINAADKNFMQKAWDKNIFPVGPSGLINMLSFAKFQISDQLRHENYRMILEEVRKLLMSVNSLSSYSKKIGTNLQNAVSNYDKFAASFNRNFLSKARNIEKLGITGSGKQTDFKGLERLQVIASKSELIDISPESDDNSSADDQSQQILYSKEEA